MWSKALYWSADLFVLIGYYITPFFGNNSNHLPDSIVKMIY